MPRLSMTVFVLCAFATATALPAFADDDDAGKFNCYTRAGREVPGDSFKLGTAGNYGNKQDPNQGGYTTDGRTIYFHGGARDGTAALVLPDGGIKVGKYSFCYPAKDKGSHAIADKDH